MNPAGMSAREAIRVLTLENVNPWDPKTITALGNPMAPLMRAFVDDLPAAGEVMSAERRESYMRLMRSILDLLYPQPVTGPLSTSDAIELFRGEA